MENKGVLIDPPNTILWDMHFQMPSVPSGVKRVYLSTTPYTLHIEGATKEYLQENLVFEAQCYWWIESISKSYVKIRVTNLKQI